VIYRALHTTLHGVGPRTTDDALELTLSAGIDLTDRSGTGEEPPGAALEGLLRWASRHTERIEWPSAGDGEPDAINDPTPSELDAALMPAELVDYSFALVDAVSLPEDVAEAAATHFGIAAASGCTCRVCRGEWAHERRRDAGCLFKDTPDFLWGLLGQWWPVSEEPVGAKPYAFYQLRSLWQAARGKAHVQREHAKQRKSSIEAKLKARGLL